MVQSPTSFCKVLVLGGLTFILALVCVVIFFTAHVRFSPYDQRRRNKLRSEPKVSSFVAVNSIAILVPVRAPHGTSSVQELALFQDLLPSLFQSLLCDAASLQFAIYVGYDAGDPFYDDSNNLETLQTEYQKLWSSSLIAPITKVAPPIVFLRLVGMAGAPCWIWNILADRAYNDGHSYFFQVNDDNKILSPCWASHLKSHLDSDSISPGFGVSGPIDLNNPRILTQALVHRVHLEIFGKIYPDSFRNWYSDDWLSHVYGSQHTTMDRRVAVLNSQSAGTRYQKNEEAKQWVQIEIERGQRLINHYIESLSV